MKRRKSLKYILPVLLAVCILAAGCNKPKETVTDNYQVSEEDLAYALPKIGEAAITKAEIKAGSKGTISVATVGSPNTEILQKAAEILEEKGYILNIQVCEDYVTPNEMLSEGKVDCNYYQHAAFLDRYNVEKQTNLLELAKIHYEPMAIFSGQTKALEETGKGAKIAVGDNPTAMAQALWLLHEEGLLTLMSDADMTAMVDDIAQNPLQLEFVSMKEEEILKNLEQVDLAICHRGYALKEGIKAESILLAEEEKESMAAQMLAQAVVVSDMSNSNAKILVDVLMSAKIQEYMDTKYQGSIYRMDGMLTDMQEEEE